MPERPLPQARGEEKAFFADARAEHRLPYYRCTSCQRLYSRPHERCTACGSTAVGRLWSTGSGTVYSLTEVHRAGHPWFADQVPYTVAIVDLDEGFRCLADLVLPPYAEPAFIGQRVTAQFEDISDALALVHFMGQS
ncbi:OB-fold domain-containing protein [soil metagenome]